MSRRRATALGAGAVVLWSGLALLTVATRPVPPFLLAALTFGLGGAAGLAWAAVTGGLGRLRAVPLGVYALGTAGLFGYHALYFVALRLAPPAEASLVAYLWPLLIVLFSGLLPGERLRAGQVAGAAVAFAGAAVLVLPGGRWPDGAALPGLGLALIAALTWAGYSLFSRRHPAVPTEAVAVFCVASALLAAAVHVAAEPTALPEGTGGWAAVAALGLGPLGLAFYLWDAGMKRGDVGLLGVASYAAPLLSTIALVLAGAAPATPALLAAAGLIAGGALIAARAGRSRLSPAGGGGSLP